MTSRGLHLPPDIDFEGWAALGSRIAGLASACAWCLGDWLVFGERAYGERYRTALAATRLDYQTLRNYAWVARKFPLARRRGKLSLHHHAEVAALSEREQDVWLERAERFGWSKAELRRQLKSRRSATEPAEAGARAVVRLNVTASRQQRWEAAAATVNTSLSDWMTQILDDAAAQVMLEQAMESREQPRLREVQSA
jgi:uncharacterized protein (DUF1778 family)